MKVSTENARVNSGESAGLGFGEVREFCAMDLFPIAVDGETMGKICKLAHRTMVGPHNADAEDMADRLLNAALDAALVVHDGEIPGVNDLFMDGAARLELVEDRPPLPANAGLHGFFLSQETEKVVLSCCKAAGVNPNDFVESWIGGLVESSLSENIETEGITADLLSKFGRLGEKDPDAYAVLLGKLSRIMGRARARARKEGRKP